MAISRVKTWIKEVLTYADLNAEFSNILDNALSAINPLTGNLACGDNDLTGIDELAFTNAAAAASAAGRLRRNGTGLYWHNGTSSGILLYEGIAGTVTLACNLTMAGLVTGAGFTGSGNVAITPAAVSGTPAQHGLFRENVVKGWVNATIAGTINDSYNVSSITDSGVGSLLVTWDRDFASANYVAVATPQTSGAGCMTIVDSMTAGATSFINYLHSGGQSDPGLWLVMAIGDQ